ncbi:hypothetical protein Baya_4666 [Bagarius yarrelli]|uniref:Uncharacterized protein n=1 Tax=Bagarius yarrelli TaxID=175774 RepID=A0A556TT79_BAGYA|nr:hypothetical protein Baya_4666 [Bagarius yarrelli]
MYLLDGNCVERMDRGTPQRKTVYRISLTLVKRESLQEGGSAVPSPRRLENPKVSAYRREGSIEIQRSCLLEQVKEVEDETDDLCSQVYRNFRTFSTGQLELGRSKISRKALNLRKEHSMESNKMCARTEDTINKAKENLAPLCNNNVHRKTRIESSGTKDVETELSCREAAGHGEIIGVKTGKILQSSRSAEEQVSMCASATQESVEGGGLPKDNSFASLLAKGNGNAAKQAPQTPPAKRHPSLLRRSFSFRHWAGGELLRLRALSKEKHHSSSGCIGRDSAQTQPSVVLQNPPVQEAEKDSIQDADEVFAQVDSYKEPSRMERAKGKNRTLDNSDLLRLSEKPLVEKESFLRSAGLRSSGQERRLLRFFSGIFLKKDSTSTPVSSPSIRSLHKNGLMRAIRGYSQSSTESVNGFLRDGNASFSIFPLSPLSVKSCRMGMCGVAGSACGEKSGFQQIKSLWCNMTEAQELLQHSADSSGIPDS